MSEYRNSFREVEREAIWTSWRIVPILACALVLFFCIGFVMTGGNLAMFKFWAPKYENAKRQVFENNQSYVNGKRDYIAQLRLEYESSEPGSAHARALRYGTQFSNPSKPSYSSGGTPLVLPQAEPNGLFMPPTAEGTWVICGTADKIAPMLVEPRTITSPIKLKSAGEYQESK